MHKVRLETRDPLESLALLVLLVFPEPLVLWVCRDSWVCLEPEETEEPLVLLVVTESLVEWDPLDPLEPVVLLETLVCLV